MSAAAIPSPSTNQFTVGPIHFHLYGLIFGLAIIISGWWAVRRFEARGGSTDLAIDVLKWAVPAGFIGGRIYFDLTSSSEVPPHWWGPFSIWDGGLGSWGAFSAAILVAVWRLRRAGASVGDALDAVAPPFLLATGIGRFGNYVNQELYGALRACRGRWKSHRPIGQRCTSTTPRLNRPISMSRPGTS
jgi:prolipoprotein diacylglyceryl transferase